jgi:hypothetical protein
MAYDNGTFYHTDVYGNQIIDDVTIKNATINGVSLLTSTIIPISTTLAPTGSLCVCLLADNIGLYINIGTASVADWKKFGAE